MASEAEDRYWDFRIIDHPFQHDLQPVHSIMVSLLNLQDWTSSEFDRDEFFMGRLFFTDIAKAFDLPPETHSVEQDDVRPLWSMRWRKKCQKAGEIWVQFPAGFSTHAFREYKAYNSSLKGVCWSERLSDKIKAIRPKRTKVGAQSNVGRRKKLETRRNSLDMSLIVYWKV